MFASKRKILIRRCWKARVRHETESEMETPAEAEIKRTFHRILKRLKEKQLELLVQALESKGGESTECIHAPQGIYTDGSGKKTSVATLSCHIWRWPETDLNLKKMCPSSSDQQDWQCINPYHWSRLLVIDTPPPPYSPKEPVGHEEALPGSLTASANSRITGDSQANTWCRIAYWEHRDRVGHIFMVMDNRVNVFQELPHGDGMCLSVMQKETKNESVKRTREKIGLGLVLTKEEDGVWLYNRSMWPVFVHSPTLNMPNSRSFSVHRVLPGYSVKVFDHDQARLLHETCDPSVYDGPHNHSSVSVSFAKGWGRYYSRQNITSCPCWLEVLLHVHR